MRKLLSFFICLLSVASASAKLTKFIVNGDIVRQDYSKADWYRESLDSVYLALVKNDTIPVNFKMMSGNDELKMTTGGLFRILVEGGVGSYSLILNRDGYEPLRHDFKVVSEGQDVVWVRTLAMEPRRDRVLNEVEVRGTAIKMVMKGDTIVYDSRAFKLAEGSTLDALVSQLPGAQLDDDGSITVNGKKVSSLLINGNDFFNGDPEVALKNLPSYTVNKIKVYDKAGKDDNVTLASQQLKSGSEDGNIVMDVILKKEFSMATIMNVEGGYGPGIYPKGSGKRLDNRYLGRAFVIGFGKNYRWGAYGGYNNIRNNSIASSSNKKWGYNWNDDSSGDGTTAIGGMDVFYNPTKKIEISAKLDYERSEMDKEQLTAVTNFYETGNIYSRSKASVQTLSNNVYASASFRYLGDIFTLYVSPHISRVRRREHGFNFSAFFNRNPFDSYRGAVVDSLLSEKASRSLLNSLESSTYISHNSDPLVDDFVLGIWIDACWRPKKGRGLFRLSASGMDTQSRTASASLYDQPYMTDADISTIRRQQWENSKKRTDKFGANLCYEWDKKLIGNSWINTFNVEPAVGWDIDRAFNDQLNSIQLLEKQLELSSLPLPSLTAPENIRPLLNYDGNNSIRSLYLDNDILMRLNLGYSVEKAAPTDSGFNPRLSLSVNYSRRQYWRHFTYDKPYADPNFHYGVDLIEPTDQLYVGLSTGTSNKQYSLRCGLGYNYSTSLRNLYSLVPSMSNVNPFQVYLGPEAGEEFAKPYQHGVYLHSDYSNMVNHQSGWFSLNYSKYYNTLSNSSVFDPATGITTHRPMTINGNWDLNTTISYDIPFGPNDCWGIGMRLSYNHDNSVDYTSAVGEPQRSVVKTDRIGAAGSVRYKLKNGTTFAVSGNTQQRHSTSPRADFTEITAWDTEITAGTNFFLPYEIEGETTINCRFRRGYNDASMNRTEWIWNASIQKSILKGSLTFKLNAVDILGQLSNITQFVDAQGRTEKWSNTLPRYVMLTVSYNFNFTPKALANK